MMQRIENLVEIKTGKLNSNAAIENGKYPFFTCDPITLKIDTYSFDEEAVLLAGNNASGNFTAKYYKGKFDAYQRTYVITSKDKNILDIKFFCYALNMQLEGLKQRSSGSTTKFLTLGMLHHLEIPAISLEKQKRIASILSAYDDLIENNKKQIKLLEEAAQRLYKEWFVDLRFPGHENVPVVDGVPEGWSIKTLGDIADVIMGQSPKSEFYNQDKDGLPFHQGVGSYGNRFAIDGTFTTSFTRIAPKGSILFSVRAPVGRLNLTRNKIVIGRGLAAINDKRGFQSFLFYMLKERFFKDDIVGNGSIFASISKDELLNQKFILANVELIEKFNSLASEIDERLSALDRQIQLLSETRDRLLPKFMSGEIEV